MSVPDVREVIARELPLSTTDMQERLMQADIFRNQLLASGYEVKKASEFSGALTDDVRVAFYKAYQGCPRGTSSTVRTQEGIKAALAAAIILQRQDANVACAWAADDLDYGTFDTGCGHTFQLNEGGPPENKMKFCCYCGGTLKCEPEKHNENPISE